VAAEDEKNATVMTGNQWPADDSSRYQ